MPLRDGFIRLLLIGTSCLSAPSIAAAESETCARFQSDFEGQTISNVRIYGDQHGDLIYIVDCPEVSVGVKFGPGVISDPANAKLMEYLRRESLRSLRSATIEIVADFNPAAPSPLGPQRLLTIRTVVSFDLSQERNIRLTDEPSFAKRWRN